MAAPVVPPVASEWAERLAGLDGVRAVALGGSTATGAADGASDLDLEVYASPLPPVEARRALIAPTAEDAEIGNDFSGPGDEWADLEGNAFDVAYFEPRRMEEHLDRVLVRHEASLGYSTAFWHTLRRCHVLVDPSGWLRDLQERALGPYPEALRRAIVAKNHPVLRAKRHSYLDQIRIAEDRNDVVAVQHRATALLASVFDLLFAVDRSPSPGEMRLLRTVAEQCPLRPPGFDDQVRAVLGASCGGDSDLIPRLHALLDGVDARLELGRAYRSLR